MRPSYGKLVVGPVVLHLPEGGLFCSCFHISWCYKEELYKTIPACKAVATANFFFLPTSGVRCLICVFELVWIDWRASSVMIDRNWVSLVQRVGPFFSTCAINMSSVMDCFRNNPLRFAEKAEGDGRQSITEVVPTMQMIDRSTVWLRVRGMCLHSASLMHWVPHPLQGKQNRRSFDTSGL